MSLYPDPLPQFFNACIKSPEELLNLQICIQRNDEAMHVLNGYQTNDLIVYLRFQIIMIFPILIEVQAMKLPTSYMYMYTCMFGYCCSSKIMFSILRAVLEVLSISYCH